MAENNPVIHLVPPTQAVVIEVFGKTYELSQHPRNPSQFAVQIGTAKDAYGRLKNYYYGSPASIREAIEKVEAEKSAKRERAKRRKTAEADPEPALLFHYPKPAQAARKNSFVREAQVIPAIPAQPARFERIGVRGVDARNGSALIVRESGAKEGCRWADILRPLAGVEQKDILTAIDASAATRAAIPAAVDYADVDLPQIEMTATWDSETETWVTTWDGQEFRAEATYHAEKKLANQIAHWEIIKTYHFVLGHRYEILPLDLSYDARGGNAKVFKTKAEAQAYVKATKKYEDASKRVRELLAAARIDSSQFTE